MEPSKVHEVLGKKQKKFIVDEKISLKHLK